MGTLVFQRSDRRNTFPFSRLSVELSPHPYRPYPVSFTSLCLSLVKTLQPILVCALLGESYAVSQVALNFQDRLMNELCAKIDQMPIEKQLDRVESTSRPGRFIPFNSLRKFRRHGSPPYGIPTSVSILSLQPSRGGQIILPAAILSCFIPVSYELAYHRRPPVFLASRPTTRAPPATNWPPLSRPLPAPA